jgi:hypothetical protein
MANKLLQQRINIMFLITLEKNYTDIYEYKILTESFWVGTTQVFWVQLVISRSKGKC